MAARLRPRPGRLVIEARTETEVRGRVEVRATTFYDDATVGTFEGPFVAQIIDCSTWDEGWPF